MEWEDDFLDYLQSFDKPVILCGDLNVAPTEIDLKNPKLGFVTVTDVQCTRDLSQAKVYVTFLGKQERNDAGMKILKQSKGFIRSTLAKRMTIRKMPDLIFIQDTSLEQGNRIERILKDIQ